MEDLLTVRDVAHKMCMTGQTIYRYVIKWESPFTRYAGRCGSCHPNWKHGLKSEKSNRPGAYGTRRGTDIKKHKLMERY
jgi:hypothetical protein